MDRWTEELTQQAKGHPLPSLERAKAATPGCLSSLWSIKEEPPTPPPAHSRKCWGSAGHYPTPLVRFRMLEVSGGEHMVIPGW